VLAVCRSLLVLVAVSCVALVLPAEEPAKPPSKADIQKLVQQLGDNDFDKREEASKKLWEIGEATEPLLQEATKSDDVEVSRRARELLDKFRWGLYPDTPKAVAEAIARYQSADQGTKLGIIKELFEAGMPGVKALLKVAKVEPDAEVRRALIGQITVELNRAVPQLLQENKHELLEQLMDVGLSQDVKTGIANYTAYWLLRGKLDDRIDTVKAQALKSETPKRQAEILAYLYRARGDAAAARAEAAKAGAEELLEALLIEAGDWKQLAKRGAAVEQGNEVERLGFKAAYHRLAGNAKEFDDTVAEIKKFAEMQPAEDHQVFLCAKALFLNDRPKDALEVMARSSSRTVAFEILAAQYRYKDAFALVDKAKAGGTTDLPALEILMARTLYSLGEKEKARPVFARYAGDIKGGTDASWFETLVDAENRVGLRDDAFAHAAQVMSISEDNGWPDRLFGKLYPSRTETAVAWWRFLKEKHPEQDNPTRMKRLRSLLDGKAALKETTDLLDVAETTLKGMTPTDRDRFAVALADVAQIAGQEARGHAILEKAGTAGALQKLGDLLADKKNWERAAERYKQAWELNRQQPLPLYLWGRALVQAGQEKEGKARMEQAHWLPLGSESIRHQFALDLIKRELIDASKRENDLLLRVSEPGSYYAGEALRRRAILALQRKDFLAAAEGYEQAMLRCLRTYISFVQPSAYVGVPAMIHSQRAAGLAATGKFDEALQEGQRGQDLLPGNADLPIQLVKALDRKGKKKEAGEFFDRAVGVQEKLCQDYPKCAWAHNSYAWLAACCRRNLDKGLEHALEANKLASDHAGHLDTLAEVYFQLGQKDKAIETQKKVVALEPKRGYFRKQLARIEAGNPAADLPSEEDDDE
jgi:tetratricopeptide (TPR) repeat protein